jgi:hypothetical protein
MARLKARSVDRNRLAKKYPFIRAPKKMGIFGDKDVIIELLALSFNNESQKTGFFETPYTDTDYRIALSPRDETSDDSANVNVFIEDSLSDTSKVTVNASAKFTGIVDVIVIRVTS